MPENQVSRTFSGIPPNRRWGKGNRLVASFLRVFVMPNRAGNIGMIILFVFIIAAAFGPFLEPFRPAATGVAAPLSRPGSIHWFGSDILGRDEFSRVIAGARIAVVAPIGAVGMAVVIGVTVGLVSGFRAGTWTDYWSSRAMDFLFSFPEYVLAIVVMIALGEGLLDASIAIGIVFSPRFARIARTATMEVMAQPYVDAARLGGRSSSRIILTHILPNISGPLLVMVALGLSGAEGAYAALSFLGFGTPPPAADYGRMLASAQPYLTTDPWLVIFPSLALVVLIVAFNLVGDSIRDRFSPNQLATGGKL